MTSCVLRPIKLQDLAQLKSLVEKMESPLASLPNDKKLLKTRIELSEKSFKKNVSQPGKEYYLFALEDIKSRKIVGVSAIHARVGGLHYFFAYKIRKEAFCYLPLKISKYVDVLHFQKILKGPSELCSLYLSHEFRKQGLGTLLSLGRYFFINAFQKRFTNEIVANLKGVRDNEGKSPFWETIGKYFFSTSLATADTMKSFGHKSFIKALMPKYPIYVPLLPQETQHVLGNVTDDTQPALHLLDKLGFKKSDWIDIFDAGPYLMAKRNEIKVIQNMHPGKIEDFITEKHLNKKKSHEYLISNDLLDFRITTGDVTITDKGKILIDSEIASLLNVNIGDTISFYKYQ